SRIARWSRCPSVGVRGAELASRRASTSRFGEGSIDDFTFASSSARCIQLTWQAISYAVFCLKKKKNWRVLLSSREADVDHNSTLEYCYFISSRFDYLMISILRSRSLRAQ